MICPRCGGTEFVEIEEGPDSYEDDIFYISEVCEACRLKWDGWTNVWMDDDEIFEMAESGE